MLRPSVPFRRPTRALVLAAVLATMGVVATPARAQDGPPGAPPGVPPVAVEGAASRLTAEEVAVLRRRFPEWDAMDAAGRDRVAASVIRLRGLSPEQRARVLERGRRIDRAGPLAAETFARNLSEWSRVGPDDRQRMLQADVTARALTMEMVGRLPAEVRDTAFGPPDAPGALGPGARAFLGAAVARAWRERAAAPLVARPRLDHEPGAATSAPRAQGLRDLRDKVRAAGGEQAPEDLRRRYAYAVLEDRVAVARQAALRPGGAPGTERARLAAYGAALRELDPAAFDAVAADLAQAAARGSEGLERFRDRHLPARPALRERGMWELVGSIEARRRDLPGDLLAKADDLQAALLAALGATPEQVRALQAEKDPVARQRLLRGMLPEGMGFGGRHGFGHGRPR